MGGSTDQAEKKCNFYLKIELYGPKKVLSERSVLFCSLAA